MTVFMDLKSEESSKADWLEALEMILDHYIEKDVTDKVYLVKNGTKIIL